MAEKRVMKIDLIIMMPRKTIQPLQTQNPRPWQMSISEITGKKESVTNLPISEPMSVAILFSSLNKLLKSERTSSCFAFSL